MKKRITSIVLGVAFSINAHAGCFNADPYALPTSEIRVTIGESAEHLYGFGESPEGRASNPFSPSPSTDLRAQDAQQVSGADSMKVQYYEPSSINTYRICRTDLWLPRHSDVPNAQTLSHSKRLIAHTLSKRLIESNRTLGFSTIYAYDSKGRVIRVEEADFRGGSDTVFKPLHCRRYDDKDRVILWVNPSETHACPKGEPSLRDEWREYRYGNRNGADARLRSRWHYPEKDGWEETWTSFSIDASPDAVRGNAHVDDRRGVWEIFGSTYGKRDDNAANTVVDEFGRWNGSNYYFPNPPVSLSILENPDELYKYLRRRITHVDGRVRLVELFKPGEHVSQHRFYTLLGLVLRHEQLNQKEKSNASSPSATGGNLVQGPSLPSMIGY